MPVVNVYKTTIGQDMHGVTIHNVLHFASTVEPATGSSEDLLNDYVESVIIPPMADCLSNEWAARCIHTVKVGAGSNVARAKYLIPNVPGTVNEPAMPANLAVNFTEYTAEPTKSGRGRHFISGWPQEAEQDNCLTSDYYNLFGTLMAAMLTDPGALGGGSDYIRTHLTGNPAAPLALIRGIIRTEFSTMRSRTQRIC